jgi:hypothetical protein
MGPDQLMLDLDTVLAKKRRLVHHNSLAATCQALAGRLLDLGKPFCFRAFCPHLTGPLAIIKLPRSRTQYGRQPLFGRAKLTVRPVST